MPDLSNIVGQDGAINQLQRAMAGDRMPHAFLFAGPDGVGRRTTALALAQTLLCANPVTAKLPTGEFRRSCGRCGDCQMLQANSHPDLHMVYKELAQFHEDSSVRGRVMQELGIDVIRSFLIDAAGRLSSRGRGKVFIVLDAELMSIPAQNALLKTLEEPPPKTTIILICQQVQELLPTTLSRCCTVNFRLMDASFVAGRLVEGGLAEGEAQFWAAFTAGSLGRAMELSAQGMYDIKREILDRLGGPGGGADMGDRLAKIMDELAEQEIAATQKSQGATLSKNLASRKAAGTMLQLLASAVHDAMILATASPLPLVHADQQAQVQALAGRFSPTQLADMIEQLSELETLLWRNVNPKIVWDNVAITCSSAAPL